MSSCSEFVLSTANGVYQTMASAGKLQSYLLASVARTKLANKLGADDIVNRILQFIGEGIDNGTITDTVLYAGINQQYAEDVSIWSDVPDANNNNVARLVFDRLKYLGYNVSFHENTNRTVIGW